MFLRPLVRSATVDVGEYTYYDSYDDPLAFERDAVLYGFGPERLIIGRFCAIASGVRFLMPGANHADLGPSTYPFGVFGAGWDATMDVVMSAPSRGDTVIGHDVWLGYSALVLPGVRSAMAPWSRRRVSWRATSRRTRSSRGTPRARSARAIQRKMSRGCCERRGGTGRSTSSPNMCARS